MEIGDQRPGNPGPLDQAPGSDDREECENQTQEVCLDSSNFPLPFIDEHIASERFTWDSPSVLSTAPLVFPCHPPPSIILAGWLAQRFESFDEDEGDAVGGYRFDGGESSLFSMRLSTIDEDEGAGEWERCMTAGVGPSRSDLGNNRREIKGSSTLHWRNMVVR